MNIANYTIGMKAEGQPCVLSALNVASATAVLSDKSGDINAQISVNDDLSAMKGKAVIVSGVVVIGKNRRPLMKITDISLAKAGEYKPSELFAGLSEEKITQYKQLMLNNIRHIQHEGYRQLIGCLLNDVTVAKLASLPATISSYGRYRGGALASAAVVSEIAVQSGCVYVRQCNGMYSNGIDWSLVITGALLHTYGMITYCTSEEPFTKTDVGVNRGYVSCLQSLIERSIWEYNIPLTEVEVGKLLNVIAVSTGQVSQKTGLCSTSKESLLLVHALGLYRDLDTLDFGLSEEEISDKGYFFDKKTSRRYIAM